MKKKFASVLLCTAMTAAVLAGCGGSSSETDTTAAQTSEEGSSAEGESTDAQTAEAQTAEAAANLTEFAEVPEDVDREQTLTYAQGADPRGLDPALVDDGESSKPIVQMYEGLTKFGDSNTEVEPCLAESWDISEDGLTYTFHLRQGVKFHDGTDFNAEAVKYNIDRQTVNKTSDMLYADFVFGDVAACNVVDEYTVDIVLSKPSTPFLNNLAMSLGAPMVRSCSAPSPTTPPAWWPSPTARLTSSTASTPTWWIRSPLPAAC